MAARKEFPVKVRRVAVTNKKTGVKYIEERRYQYDPAKGYNVLLSRRRTGEKMVHLGSPWNAALTFKKKYRSSRKP